MPAYCSTSILLQALIFLALLRKKPVLLMSCSSLASGSVAKASAAGYLANSFLRDQIYPFIRALGGKDGSHQQLKRRIVDKCTFCIGIISTQSPKYLLGLTLCRGVGNHAR